MTTMILISVLPWACRATRSDKSKRKESTSAVGSAKKHWDALR
jgi:hypothetical protein